MRPGGSNGLRAFLVVAQSRGSERNDAVSSAYILHTLGYQIC